MNKFCCRNCPDCGSASAESTRPGGDGQSPGDTMSMYKTPNRRPVAGSESTPTYLRWGGGSTAEFDALATQGTLKGMDAAG